MQSVFSEKTVLIMDSVKIAECQIIAKNCIIPFPVYHDNQIIVSIEEDDSLEAGLYAYDILSDEFDKFAPYPER